MILLELIQHSKKNAKKIREQHDILREFQQAHPWHIQRALENMREHDMVNLPSFEDLVSFKEELLVDDLPKIYHQIKKNNKLLIEKGPETILFYNIKKNFYKDQIKAGFALGETDDVGNLVTGSNLIIEPASIDLKDFLDIYYTISN